MSTKAKGIAIFDLDRTITIKRTFTPFLVHVAKKRPAAFLWAPVIAVMMVYYKLGGMSRTRLKEHMLSMTLGGRHKETVGFCSNVFAEDLVAGGGVFGEGAAAQENDVIWMGTKSEDIHGAAALHAMLSTAGHLLTARGWRFLRGRDAIRGGKGVVVKAA